MNHPAHISFAESDARWKDCFERSMLNWLPVSSFLAALCKAYVGKVETQHACLS